jgi:hypothetical protein
MKRRRFIQNISALTASGIFALHPAAAATLAKAKRIILVSGWQDVNISDITHTPGLLHILETYLLDTQVTFWKRSKGQEVKAMLNRNFPKVKIIYGEVDEALHVNNPEVVEVFKIVTSCFMAQAQAL